MKKNFHFVGKDGYLNPAILQVFGLVLLAVFVIYYMMTGQTSGILIGASLALIGLGSAGGAFVTVRQEVVERSQQHQENLQNISSSTRKTIESGNDVGS